MADNTIYVWVCCKYMDMCEFSLQRQNFDQKFYYLISCRRLGNTLNSFSLFLFDYLFIYSTHIFFSFQILFLSIIFFCPFFLLHLYSCLLTTLPYRLHSFFRFFFFSVFSFHSSGNGFFIIIFCFYFVLIFFIFLDQILNEIHKVTCVHTYI